ncbi:unnamed protein product [Dibothriocephalus latus]|uniref:Uncharacterized protein n=1 Tax=Dibothriocephalus latus TaxID=60516 RepID=A0A3P7PHX4_DIBLA|nr:unnamed protein product [Dibothriocephalus latus]
MRLAAARTQAAEDLRSIECLGRSGVFVQDLPDPVSGGFPNSTCGFYLEPDGVWPTSMQKGPPSVTMKEKRTTMPTTAAARKTITDEVYVPQSYLEAYNCRPPPFFIPMVVIAQVSHILVYVCPRRNDSTVDKGRL